MILTLSFREFKENCEHNVIADYQRKENDLIYIYCLEKDIYTKKEKIDYPICVTNMDFVMTWNIGKPNWELPEETKVISMKRLSTHIFSFKKKKVDSFF